jgi:hypothetical protein
LYAFLGLDGEKDLVQRAEDLVDFADGSLRMRLVTRSYSRISRRMYLVLEVDGRVEIGNLGVDGFAEHLVLDVVHEFAHF